MSDPANYTVGWICAVETEYVAAQECLDAEHPRLAAQDANDNNIYTLGSIGSHNVVIACLPHWNYGLVSAANVARDMLRTFPNLRFGLMVGIGGGVPTKQDVRLGDIVVSSRNYENGAVLQYNFGQTVQDKAFRMTGYLDAPPLLLQAAVQQLNARYRRHGNMIDKAINAILERNPRLRDEYRRPDPATDRLYQSTVVHRATSYESCIAVCGEEEEDLIVRTPRSEDEDNPKLHYGLIASADQLIKDAMVRDRLAEEKGVLCFEMEAAGLMNHFKCLVIRGICDYADSHKNEEWQGYAAMAAAVYAKDLLGTIVPTKVAAERKLGELLGKVYENLRDVQTLASETRHNVGELKMDSHLKKIRSWLKPPDTARNFNNARTRHQGNTGQWFLNNETYLKWKKPYLKGAKGSNSFLWLNGIPGCGKTILSSSVVADLEQSAALSTNLIYFYFDFNDVEKQSLENAVRSLITQLYHKRSEVRAEVDTLYSSCGKGAQQPSIAELHNVFLRTLQHAGEIWIVLDALDECSTRDNMNGLLPWIEDLRKSDLHIHILVTSRPEIDIKSVIEGWAGKEEIISVQGQPVENDIKSYVQAKTKLMWRWKDRQDIQQEVETALTKAHGMFRWVSCQFDSLDKCLDPKSVRKALADLPRTLDDTYARILKAVPPEHLFKAKRLLQFLTYSERPLRLEEAVDAVAVDIDNRPRFDTGNRMFVPEEVVQYCSSLISLVRKNDTGDGTARMEIQLAHFSVKQYLMSDRLQVDV
ncbi:nucleoside phosphorylase domain-containing protein, partial [Apodospora peruviana]